MENNYFCILAVLILVVLAFFAYRCIKIEGLSNHVHNPSYKRGVNSSYKRGFAPSYKRGVNSRTSDAVRCMNCMDTCMETAMNNRNFKFYRDRAQCRYDCEADCSPNLQNEED